MNHFNKILGSFVLHLLVKETVYKLYCPRESIEAPGGQTGHVFKFLFQIEDEDINIHVNASNTLLASADILESGVIGWEAIRAAKHALRKSKEELLIHTKNYHLFADDSLLTLSEPLFRSNVKEYLLKRYDINFEEPFSVIELIVAMESTPSRVIRALRYLHKHEKISFDWSPEIWPEKKGEDQWLNHQFAVSSKNYERLKSEMTVNKLPELTHVESPKSVDWDFFICHASEDKKEVAKPLALALSKLGAKVWYDEWSLKIGDSLSAKIDQGLRNSRYGIVIISPSFFGKRWPEKELDALVQKEINGEDVILPIWHNVDYEFVASKSLLLASKVAGTTGKGTDELAKQIIMERFDAGDSRNEMNITDKSTEHPQGPQSRSSNSTNSKEVAHVFISYIDAEIAKNEHSYELIVSLTLLTPPDQGRIRFKFLWPFIVPILHEQNVKYKGRTIIKGVVESREFEVNYEERIFSGETIQLLGPKSQHRVKYKFDQNILNEIETKETLLRYSVHFEDHQAMHGVFPFQKLHKF